MLMVSRGEPWVKPSAEPTYMWGSIFSVVTVMMVVMIMVMMVVMMTVMTSVVMMMRTRWLATTERGCNCTQVRSRVTKSRDGPHYCYPPLRWDLPLLISPYLHIGMWGWNTLWKFCLCVPWCQLVRWSNIFSCHWLQLIKATDARPKSSPGNLLLHLPREQTRDVCNFYAVSLIIGIVISLPLFNFLFSCMVDFQ